jgi:hypothetical protein
MIVNAEGAVPQKGFFASKKKKSLRGIPDLARNTNETLCVDDTAFDSNGTRDDGSVSAPSTDYPYLLFFMYN